MPKKNGKVFYYEDETEGFADFRNTSATVSVAVREFEEGRRIKRKTYRETIAGLARSGAAEKEAKT